MNVLTVLWFSIFSAAEPTFYRDVRPILAKHCTVCHNNENLDNADESGGVSLAEPDAVFKTTKKELVSLNQPDKSPLYLRVVATDAAKRMPKDDKPLDADQIATIRRWIETGAKLGDPADAPAAIRKRTRPRVFRELTLLTEATIPAGALDNPRPAKLSFSGKLAPLAPVQALAFSPDGKYLASGSFRKVVLWNLRDATVSTILTDPIGMVHDLEFSPDGARLWLAGGDPTVRGELLAYDTQTWKPAARFDEPRDVLYNLDISPKGDRLAVVGFDRYLRVFALPQLRPLFAVKAHSDFAYGVSLSADGKKVVTSGKDRAVKLWNVDTGDSIRVFNGHQQEVFSVLISSDATQIFSTGLEPNLRTWTVASPSQNTQQNAHGGAVHQLSWNPRRTGFVTASADGTARTWLPAGRPDKVFRAAGDTVYAAALSADGKLVAGGGSNGLIRIWDGRSTNLLATLLTADRPDDSGSDWAIFTSAGYFAASSGLKSRGVFRLEGRAPASEQTYAALAKSQQVAKILSLTVPDPIPGAKPVVDAKKPPIAAKKSLAGKKPANKKSAADGKATKPKG